MRLITVLLRFILGPAQGRAPCLDPLYRVPPNKEDDGPPGGRLNAPKCDSRHGTEFATLYVATGHSSEVADIG